MQCWFAAREYSRFSHCLVENQGSQELVDAFRTFLADKYADGRYPSPPVAHTWEGDAPRWYGPSSSSTSSDSPSSSVELPEGGS